MRVALLTWNYPPKLAGGTEIATQIIARHLAHRGHEVLVVTTRDTGLSEESMEQGFRIYRVKSLKPKLLKYVFFCFKTVLISKRFRPDLIHAQAIITGLPALIAKRVTGRPYLVWARGGDVYSPGLFKGPISRAIIQNADSVIALTADMKKEMQKVCNRDIHVIGNGVEPERFARPGKTEARGKLHIGADEKVLIFAGSLVPVKGLIYLIEAVNIITQQQPEARLLILGDGKERHSLETLVARLGLEKCVTFTGRVDNAAVPEFLAAADVFVLPSLSEGFPNVIAEAMACGLPVVCTRIRGIPEIVADGVNGFLVAPRNPAELADKIVSLLSNGALREEISATNKAWAKANSWDKIVDRLEEVYFAVTQAWVNSDERHLGQ